MPDKHASSAGVATLHTASAEHPMRVVVAASFLPRLKGLMFTRTFAGGVGREGAQALLITRCPSVHTAFMRYPVDVVYLDNQGTVLQCVANLQPWRASVCKPAKPLAGQRINKPIHTLELAEGSIAQMNIQLGDQLSHAFFKKINANEVTLTQAATQPITPPGASS
jgi:uncharacterized protein